jgi:putative PIN family toxin of toxin-antitoxin system
MRAVLDTNVVVSALLWAGIPGELIHAARSGRVELATSPPLLAELTDVLGRRRFEGRIGVFGLTVDQIVDGYAALARIVRSEQISGIAPDLDDDVVLGTAVAGGAEMIVSGDAHLLGLGTFEGISIVSPATALEKISIRATRRW